MTSRTGLGGLAAAACVATVLPAWGSVTRGEPLNGVPTDAFSAVGLLGHGVSGNNPVASGVAILDGFHMLTTRHAVTMDGSIGGTLRDPTDLWFEAGDTFYSGVDLYADFGGDLALIRLDGAVTDPVGLWSSADGSELGEVFRGVGFGVNNVDGDSQWGPGQLGTKRTFSNRIDAIAIGGISGQGEVLRYDFDLVFGNPVSGLEGLHGPGDSGGAALLPDPSGGWLLAGLLSSAGDPIDQASGSAVRIASYHDAIVATVPEPSVLLFLTAVGAAWLVRRGWTTHG